MLKENQPLHIVAYHKILRMIREGTFEGKLPAEKQMAEMLGVSRTTLRQALLILQEDHVVYTKRGSGTYIASGKPPERHRGIESYFPIHKIVDSPDVQISEPVVSIEKTDAIAAEQLGIPASSSLVIVSRACSLRKEIFAYTVDFLPVRMLDDDVEEMMGDFINFGRLVDEVIPTRVYSAECEIIPSKAGEYISQHLNIGKEAPVLLLHQLLRDQRSAPLSLNKTYIDTAKVSVNLLRKNNTQMKEGL